ncbi:peptide MFS transporter [Phenylobacterium sp.]|uniref:peptide MFS transporter n=1 Tax=Phenylobacterium sp. TaxID=1871053 RepID=UPI00374CB7CB
MTAVTSDADDRSFMGHPKALAFISFTEAWERFSYYGMMALLALYMSKQLLQPGHIEHVIGMDAARWFLNHTYGHGAVLSVLGLGSAIYGFYSSTVYLTPIFGGLLADYVLGRTRTVILGACLMALGHFLMAFDQSFLMALTCLMLGAGCLKGNLATQVGSLYPAGDNRRADAFQIYYLGINGGVIFGPTVTVWLGQGIAWHYGFGAAGVGMLVSLVIYLSGRRFLPPDPPRGVKARAMAKAASIPMTAREWQVVILLVLLLPVLALSIVGNNQIFNAYLLWADKSVDLHPFGFNILTGWLVSVDSVVSVATLILVVWLWRVWAKRFPEPDEMGKIVIGCALGALGVLCLVAGSTLAAASGQKVSFGWLLGFHLLNDIGFANVLPVGLAFYTRAAPRAMAGFVVGLYYLHLWAGNTMVGLLGGLLETMPAAKFWLIHAILVASAGVVFFVVRLFFGRLLRGEPAQPDFVAADAGETP